MALLPTFSDFVSAGFLITRPVARASYFSQILLPEAILSASDCIATFVPDTWCLEWAQDAPETRQQKAQMFLLGEAALADLTEWATNYFDVHMGWPNVLLDFETARELALRFLNSVPDLRILELGLHQQHVEAFCKKAEPPAQQPGFSPSGRQGVHVALLRGQPLATSGHVLGFEPLVFEHTLSCSWLCNGLETLVAEQLDIKPNAHGLIDSFDQACRCINLIAQEQMGAEPGLWLPWLIMDQTDTIRCGQD